MKDSSAALAIAPSPQEKPSGNPMRVRQDRHLVEDVRFQLKTPTGTFEVVNYSAFGLAVFHAEPLPEGSTWPGCSLWVEGHRVAALDVRMVRQQELPGGGHKIAFEITSEPLRVEKLSLLPEIWRSIEAAKSGKHRLESLRAEVREPVYHLKSSLERFKAVVDELAKERSFESVQQMHDFESAVIDLVVPELFNFVPGFFKSFHAALAGASMDEIKAAFQFFREETRPLLYRSPFVTRTLEKPLGYAGDFEMMNLIYRNELQGESLFHKCVERFFLLQPEPYAVRNRVEYLLGKIRSTLEKTSGPVRILSVASGPAMEIQKAVEHFRQEELSRLEVHLLDQDLTSLKHAQRQIRQNERVHGKSVRVDLMHCPIKKVIGQGIPGGHEYDLIYSAGLFDYFADDVARMAGGALLKALRSESKMVIGNFDLSTPSAFPMSVMWDWNLVYRSREDLERIFKFPGTSLEVEQEARQINLFCVVTKA
jgi:extracellular factor (EF) 3-hydroxypalmitic acid methyl ester biosynthesis protein